MSNIYYISIADYAKKIGISISEAKEELKEIKYNDYWKDTPKGIIVKSNIYELRDTADIATESQPHEETEVPLPVDTKPANTEESASHDEVPDPKQEKIERLEKEIEALRQAITEKDKQILDFAKKFADLATQAQQIAGQAQYLQLQEKAPTAQAQIGSEIEPDQTEAPTDTTQNIKMAQNNAQESPKKKSLWKRLFG